MMQLSELAISDKIVKMSQAPLPSSPRDCLTYFSYTESLVYLVCLSVITCAAGLELDAGFRFS